MVDIFVASPWITLFPGENTIIYISFQSIKYEKVLGFNPNNNNNNNNNPNNIRPNILSFDMLLGYIQ